MLPRFRLHLLGSPSFVGPGGPVSGRAAHKRRVALLAVLALARGRPVGRERLIGLLWAELTTDAARHNLSESLYVLRKELGDEALVSASAGDVALVSGVVATDVGAFHDALEAGEAERAVALYGGPLLDGFYVADAPEFERWAEGERDRLARAFARALEGLAEAAEADGSAIRAVDWWRRLSAHDPFSSRTALRLVRALDAAGERPSALRAAEAHAALLREELGVDPDPDLKAFVARLRGAPDREAAPLPPLARAEPAAHPPFAPQPFAPLPLPSAHTARSADSLDLRSSGDPLDSINPIDSVDHHSVDAAGSVDRVNSIDSVDSVDRHSVDAAGSVDRVDSIHSVDSVDHHSVDAAGSVDRVDSVDSVGSVDSIDSADSVGSVDFINPVDSVDPVDAVDAVETVETARKRRDGASAISRSPAVRIVDDAEDGARHGRPGRVSARAAAYQAGIAGLLLGMMLSVLSVWAADRRARDAEPAYDPRRIAVLYFDDVSPRGEMQYLAGGLTEMLIHELSQVPALRVISLNGVKPYRGGAVRFDSMVADLRVGSVVEGTLQRSGDSVWVTVDLVDAASGAHLESREVHRPMGDVVALERAVAEEVAAALRRRLGQEVRLRAARAETPSAEARELVMVAAQARRDAASLAASHDPLDAGSAARLLDRADSLLARAQAADPRWAQPVLLRGWVDVGRAAALPGPRRAELLRAAAGRGTALVRRGDAGPEALELRGSALYRLALDGRDTLRQAALLDSAEHDLRAAVAAEPSLAGAWSTLSQLLRIRGRLAESDLAARRALAEDAYLDDAADIRHRLFFSALRLGDYPQAREQCEHGYRQLPRDWRFVECRLTLLGSDRSRPPDAAEAWRLVAELDRVDPPERARSLGRGYSPVYRRMVAAAVLARAGLADSAHAVAARARREVGADPDLASSLDYDEAWVRLLTGDSAGARRLLDGVEAHRPALRPYLRRDPLFRALWAAPARR